MSKMAAIGPRNLFGGFKALGVEIFHVDAAEKAKEVLEKIIRTKEYSIIFLLEQFAADMQEIVDRVGRQTSPTLLVLPGMGERMGYGADRIGELVRKAAGQDIK